MAWVASVGMVWAAINAVTVCICVMAARGDRSLPVPHRSRACESRRRSQAPVVSSGAGGRIALGDDAAPTM